MGTGLYAGLGGMKAWRIKSNDRSFEQLNFHDLRVSLGEGSYVPAGKLERAIARMRDPRLVQEAEERLIAPTQIDATRPGRTVLVPGRIVGVPVAGPGSGVDRIHAARGRSLEPRDRARRVAVLDRSFSKYYDLPDSGRVRLGGAGTIPYVGQGLSPQHFLITQEGALTSEATLGIVYLPLRAAQRAAGRPGAVNELVLTLASGVSVARAERELGTALRAALPGVGTSITRGTDEDAYRILYRDARNDQRFMNVFAFLILAGASFAAFNLISRVVESERREIGIGMALGVPPRELALRPLLLGVEIALLGVAFGIAVGLWAANALGSVYEDALPLPSYVTAFQPDVFAAGAALGFFLPLAATAFAVWRGVRVTPIEAIRVGFRSAKGGGLAPLLKRVSPSGHSLVQLPVRNVARAPRRTILTLLGLAGVISTVVALSGMLDSLNETIDRSQQETLRSSPSRLTVTLDRFYARDSRPVREIGRTAAVDAAEADLNVLSTLRPAGGGEDFDISLALIDSSSRIWRPSVDDGSLARGSRGIVISRKAADDLGVGPGDEIVLRHPALRRGGTLALADTAVRVAGLHPNPFRFFAYMDHTQASRLGLGGVVNSVTVTPAPGGSADRVERDLFGMPGVAQVQPVTADTDALEENIRQFSSVIQVTAGAALILALLMAFNSTGISVEERRREFATMFAFGLPPRTGVRVAMVESLITGVLGTIVGLAIGLAVVGWVVNALMPSVWPDIGTVVSISAGSVAAAFVVGVGAVTLAPLLMIRRLRRMDVPATLRVVE
jgi:putative ABC transport system permease protein